MIFPKNVKFTLRPRVNVHSIRGTDWVLAVNLGDSDWVVWAWDHEPVKKQIIKVMQITTRSFDIYHRHIKIGDCKVKDYITEKNYKEFLVEPVQ